MNSQLYTATSGLIVEQRRLEVISNNLANLSTAGFRAERTFSAIYRGLIDAGPSDVRAANAAVALAGTYEVPGQGPLRETGRALDVVLEDGTFLVVETESGRAYTRRGDLQVSADGALRDGGGHRLLDGKGEPITALGPGATVSADGRVVEEGAERGRLSIVRDPQQELRPTGAGLLRPAGEDAGLEPVTEPQLQPGWLEGSGTQALGELVRLIEAQRAFDSYQKLVQLTMNEINRRAVNEIAGS